MTTMANNSQSDTRIGDALTHPDSPEHTVSVDWIEH